MKRLYYYPNIWYIALPHSAIVYRNETEFIPIRKIEQFVFNEWELSRNFM